MGNEFLGFVGVLVLIVGVFFLLYNYFLNRHFSFAKIKSQQEIAFPLRLQAYERMALFLERIKPENMFTRLNFIDLTVESLQSAVISDIKNELNHNIAQQIYIQPATWDTIVLAANSTALDLNQQILSHRELDNSRKIVLQILKNKDLSCTQNINDALSILKTEIQKYF
ncbi:hypothetical protein EGI26_03070 [Lacihabitans sp. CCS-44]|uniref:DUF7935 family protein n=1 Tax=Lacihabitans sp. CCS-44 TaxID=2487331 RepID=UPI0020CC49EE|nr:hypothetical protein [Lacihabitans sp. CCS-44]MCP9754144.1 hypothetical protein [Lacihabitans sp. CCS-44]